MRTKRLSYSAEKTGLTRRELIAAGLTLPAGAALLTSPAELNAQAAAKKLPELDIAEWSFFWTGIERADLGNGPVVNGKQMYVEYQIPRNVRYPYPIVLVHGGGGQGLDWMGTPDGRRGWSTLLLEQGFMVYIVDRPGHGRSPYHPDLHGGWPGPQTLESISGLFTPMRAQQPQAPQGKGKAKGGPGGFGGNNNAHLHNQWPGTGAVGTPELAQLVAGQGGAYRPGPGTGPASQVEVWTKAGAEMLDKIGIPVIVMTHSAGGPFGYYCLEARPNLVKGIIVNEGAGGAPFSPQNRWGLTATPVAYDPPVNDPSEIKTVQVQPTPEDAAMGIGPYTIQAEPARKLKNWQNAAIAVYTAEASFVNYSPSTVAYLKQAGVKSEEIRIKDLGIHGNGHAMMLEKNNREALQPIVDWIKKHIPAKGAPARKATAFRNPGDSTAIRLADQGYFWVGFEEKKVQAGTILAGQTFVQWLKPARKRSQYPVVLVHGGAGQGTHYMGIGQLAGWAHYWIQAGYDTYIVDRPGHGRAVYHPDALGPISPVFNYASITGDFKRAAVEPNRRWMGTGDVGDPLIDQFQAGQGSLPTDTPGTQRLWARGAKALLDRIGPSIVMVHSAGGPWSWIAAEAAPGKVKAILNFEGAGAAFGQGNAWGLTQIPMTYDPPVSDPAQLVSKQIDAANGAPAYRLLETPRKLTHLQGIPIAYIVAERSGRNATPTVEFLKQCGCAAEALNMKDKGVLGNGHFMNLESNRKQAFDVIRAWLESKV